IRATVVGDANDPAWDEGDALLVRLVDELHDTGHVSDDLWAALALRWSVPQLLELLVLAGWYHVISYVANGARVALEEWAGRFPEAAGDAERRCPSRWGVASARRNRQRAAMDDRPRPEHPPLDAATRREIIERFNEVNREHFGGHLGYRLVDVRKGWA